MKRWSFISVSVFYCCNIIAFLEKLEKKFQDGNKRFRIPTTTKLHSKSKRSTRMWWRFSISSFTNFFFLTIRIPKQLIPINLIIFKIDSDHCLWGGRFSGIMFVWRLGNYPTSLPPRCRAKRKLACQHSFYHLNTIITFIQVYTTWIWPLFPSYDEKSYPKVL